MHSSEILRYVGDGSAPAPLLAVVGTSVATLPEAVGRIVAHVGVWFLCQVDGAN